jgi:hypothetical protein
VELTCWHYLRPAILDFAAELYCRLTATNSEVEKNRDLLIIEPKSETEAYTQVNHTIVDNALSLGSHLQERVAALRVWDGKSRGEGVLLQPVDSVAKYALGVSGSSLWLPTLPFKFLFSALKDSHAVRIALQPKGQDFRGAESGA